MCVCVYIYIYIYVYIFIYLYIYIKRLSNVNGRIYEKIFLFKGYYSYKIIDDKMTIT